MVANFQFRFSSQLLAEMEFATKWKAVQLALQIADATPAKHATRTEYALKINSAATAFALHWKITVVQTADVLRLAKYATKMSTPASQ